MTRAISVRGVGKRFPRRGTRQALTFRRFVEGGWRRTRSEEFWALRDVSFDVASGEMLGVIGHNGSGKSTLLRILGGVMVPDSGYVVATHPVTGLLDLSAGMHPDLSGRDNAVIGGVVLGLLRNEIEARLDSIFAFAGLEAFADSPVRSYSSGMKLRLGFAVAAHAEPKILLIDEVLAVGDIAFQEKCLDRVREFRASGATIVLISHDLGQIETMCDRALWLSAGEVRGLETPRAMVARYRNQLRAETQRRTPGNLPEVSTPQGIPLRAGENRFGTFDVRITAVRMRDAGGRPVDVIESGQALTVEVELASERPVESAHVSVAIVRPPNSVCVELNTGALEVPAFAGRIAVALSLDRLDLAPGQYTISVGVWERDWQHAFDFHESVYDLVVSGPAAQGILLPPHRWTLAAGER